MPETLCFPTVFTPKLPRQGPQKCSEKGPQKGAKKEPEIEQKWRQSRVADRPAAGRAGRPRPPEGALLRLKLKELKELKE